MAVQSFAALPDDLPRTGRQGNRLRISALANFDAFPLLLQSPEDGCEVTGSELRRLLCLNLKVSNEEILFSERNVRLAARGRLGVSDRRVVATRLFCEVCEKLRAGALRGSLCQLQRSLSVQRVSEGGVSAVGDEQLHHLRVALASSQHQRCFFGVDACAGVWGSAGSYESLRFLQVSANAGHVQSGPPVPSDGVRVCAGTDQAINDLHGVV